MERDSDSMRLLLKVQHMLAELYVRMHLPKDTEMYCHKGLETARSRTVAHLDSAEVKLIVGNVYFIFHPAIYITYIKRQVSYILSSIRILVALICSHRTAALSSVSGVAGGWTAICSARAFQRDQLF